MERTYRVCTYFVVLLFVLACTSKKDAVKKTAVFDAEAAVHEVDEKIKERRFEEARELLGDIKRNDTSGEYILLAEVRTGDTFYMEGQYEAAAVEYGHFLKIHPYHTYSSYAQYQLAMTYFKRIGTVDVSYSLAQNALLEFEKLLQLYPRNPYIKVVESRIKACKDILAEYEFYVADFYFRKGSYGAAADRLSGLLERYPGTGKESEALFYLGVSYKNMGEKDKSLSALTTLMEKYPASSKSRDAREVISSLNGKGQ